MGYEGIKDKKFVAVLDVRKSDDWNVGHIANATFIENLGSDGSAKNLVGCEECSIAVYCYSGVLAKLAIDRLREEFNFKGNLYNGMGVEQWTEAGYELVKTASDEASCKSNATSCKVESSSTGERSISHLAVTFVSLGVMWNIMFAYNSSSFEDSRTYGSDEHCACWGHIFT